MSTLVRGRLAGGCAWRPAGHVARETGGANLPGKPLDGFQDCPG